jgi:hypothetical protein|tara:strand:+ start:75572 stop:75745 length:174 start_codon:yes stop_codon:yes gene_type:complete
MDYQEKLLAGKAHVELTPFQRDKDALPVIELKIDGVYFGEFPTYTAASNHLIGLIEE